MIWKTIEHDQLFVFWNGQLVFKRWLDTGTNAVLDLPYTYWFRDEDQ